MIKSVRQNAGMDQAEAQKVWTSLQGAIIEIYNKNACVLSFEELYRQSYNLCLNKHGDLLYNGTQSTIRTKAAAAVVEVSCLPDDVLLDALLNVWNEHKTTLTMIKDILMYMDRTWVPLHKKMPVYNLSLRVFREVLVQESESLIERLRSLLLANVLNERQGLIIDKSLMKGILSMLVDLGVESLSVYEEDFERAFIESTKTFYRQESQQYLVENQCPEYLYKAEMRLQEEAHRSHSYLASSTEPKLMHCVEHELITVHSRALVDMQSSGCIFMMRENKIDDLKRMYSLFSRVPSTLDYLRECMSGYVKKCGLATVANQENAKEPVAFVQQMLELKDKFDMIINQAFRGEKKAFKDLKSAFEDIINKDTRCASHLSCYIDDLLKSGLKGMTEHEAEERLDRVIVIFRFLSDKDIFEEFYKNHLAKRLLTAKSVSDEMEKAMIAKLKAECGQQFTSKMEGMFLDMNLSKEIMDSYRPTSYFSTALIEMEVQTLTTAHWSLKVLPPCTLPSPAVDACDRFTSFYLEKFKTGRRLTWMTNYGTVDLRASFPSGRKELNVSTYQMCMLMLFNDSTKLSLNQIRAGCSIIEPELRRHLLSLCTPKLKILKKSSKGKGIEDNDVFEFNDEFASKFKRMKVPLISAKEVLISESDHASAVPQTVEEDRRHQVEASIVRVMKARKKITHNDLVAEITRQLSFRFTPSPPFIKKRIESLIEREYLQRDIEDTRSYKYLA